MTTKRNQQLPNPQLIESARCHCKKCEFVWTSQKILKALLSSTPPRTQDEYNRTKPATCPRCHAYFWEQPMVRKHKTKTKTTGKGKRKR